METVDGDTVRPHVCNPDADIAANQSSGESDMPQGMVFLI